MLSEEQFADLTVKLWRLHQRHHEEDLQIKTAIRYGMTDAPLKALYSGTIDITQEEIQQILKQLTLEA